MEIFEENLSYYHLVDHKSNVICPGIEYKKLRQKVGD
jgi:hypothetical protein